MNTVKYLKKLSATLALMIFVSGIAAAEDGCTKDRVVRSSIYVPVYSHIYTGDKLRPFNLAVTISVRNTDPGEPIEVKAADYYSSSGDKIRSLLENKIIVPPLGAYSFKIKESDIEGGSGASVLLLIASQRPTRLPMSESIQAGTASGQGISFPSRGRVLTCD